MLIIRVFLNDSNSSSRLDTLPFRAAIDGPWYSTLKKTTYTPTQSTGSYRTSIYLPFVSVSFIPATAFYLPGTGMLLSFNQNFFFTCTWRNGYLWTYIMFFDPRNPILRLKILKNHGIMAPIGPEWAFLPFFDYFYQFLPNKSLKSMRKGFTFNRYYILCHTD